MPLSSGYRETSPSGMDRTEGNEHSAQQHAQIDNPDFLRIQRQCQETKQDLEWHQAYALKDEELWMQYYEQVVEMYSMKKQGKLEEWIEQRRQKVTDYPQRS